MVRLLKDGNIVLNHARLGVGNIYLDLGTGLVYRAWKSLLGALELYYLPLEEFSIRKKLKKFKHLVENLVAN